MSAAMLMPLSSLVSGSVVFGATGTWQNITHSGSFASPWGIAVDRAGDVFVVNNENNGTSDVVEELPAGSTTWKDITYNASGIWTYPQNIAVNRSGDLFVTVGDGTNNGVWELPHGTTTWIDINHGFTFSDAGGIVVDSVGDVFVVNTNATPTLPNAVVELPYGSSTWQDITNGYPNFDNPDAIAVDNTTGDLFVTNRADNTVVEMVNGVANAASGGTWQDITNAGPFSRPYGIAVNDAGDVYVGNRNNTVTNAVVELPSGSNTWQDASNGGQFSSSAGIAVDSLRDLFVTNQGSNTVLEYEVVPSVPTGLSATSTTYTGTTLSWNTVAGASSYDVYENGDSTPIATGVTGTSHTVTGLTPGTSYSLTVSAVSSAGSSAQSNAIGVLTLPSAPTGLVSSSTSSMGTTLRWNPVTGATSYNVYEGGAKISTGVTNTGYTVSNLASGIGYSFTVSAVDASGESAQSTAVSVNTASIGSVDLMFTSTDAQSGAPQSVVGVVYDVHGAPIENAVVDLTDTIGRWSQSSVTTDVNGQFATAWIAPSVTSEMSGTVTATVYGTVYGAVRNVTPTTLTVSVAPLPRVLTTTLAKAMDGTRYSQTLSATGGFAPLTWSITSGALPTGMVLDSSMSVIKGTPTVPGTYTFTVQAKDAQGNTANRQLQIVVRPSPTITTMTLMSATEDTSYSQTLSATGGDAPYSWSVISGSLPEGLTLDANTGVIHGSLMSVGTTTFTVQLKDTDGTTATQDLAITVEPIPTYTVMYSGNGSTSGTTPTATEAYTSGTNAVVLGNTGGLSRVGYTFAGWNTLSTGSGTSYQAGSVLTMGAASVTLYAQWAKNSGDSSSAGASRSGSISTGTSGNESVAKSIVRQWDIEQRLMTQQLSRQRNIEEKLSNQLLINQRNLKQQLSTLTHSELQLNQDRQIERRVNEKQRTEQRLASQLYVKQQSLARQVTTQRLTGKLLGVRVQHGRQLINRTLIMRRFTYRHFEKLLRAEQRTGQSKVVRARLSERWRNELQTINREVYNQRLREQRLLKEQHSEQKHFQYLRSVQRVEKEHLNEQRLGQVRFTEQRRNEQRLVIKQLRVKRLSEQRIDALRLSERHASARMRNEQHLSRQLDNAVRLIKLKLNKSAGANR